MKMRCLIIIFIINLFVAGSAVAGEGHFVLTSPDAPSVWYNRSGDKVTQYLRWSDSKQALVAHVAYNELPSDSASWREQDRVDRFELSFPMVRLDRSTNELYVVGRRGYKITIGHIETGPFGTRVALANDLELSAHRVNGFLHAEIHSTALRKG